MHPGRPTSDPRLAARTYASADHDWHIDAALSEISIQYALDPRKYISPLLMPTVPVGKQSDRYYIWEKADWFRLPTTALRARATAPKRIESTISSAGFYCDNYMLEMAIPYEDLTNADEALQLEDSTARQLMQVLMLDQEDRVATLLTTAANAGSGTALTGTNRWNDGANSSPVSDVSTGKAWMRLETGYEPNTMIVGAQVHDALRLHPDIIDRIKFVQRTTQATIDAALADIFGVEKYLVGSAIKNTGAEGQSATMAYIWGKNIVLAYVTPAPGRNVPSMGYFFRWKPEGFTDFVVETKDDDTVKARLKRCGYFQDEVITAKDMLYLMSTVVD
jgi:hypothetical protein